ncbi:plastocyanin/azurin family copper-binding protein [Salinisphaera sp. Q1T1-3]|uniref:plastocyanin/azurin family copper-binding protein n=1 Tax=Salinisphaera sp. Q1T1-3 TaxID=2321229 RepID=UPI000E70B42C|nr:plastocyanin/azurin family copper-binding protein [Salinisphaera sp. Q1T1-3]RJS94263.1 Azurin [Salinisphaera sp. Q1T1-3]
MQFRLRHCLALTTLALVAATAHAEQQITLVGQNDLRYSKSQLTAAPGERIRIKLINKSHLPASAMSHNWVLLKHGTDADAFDHAAQSASGNGYFPKSRADQAIAHTDMVAGGKQDTVTFTAPKKPGDYEYICTFPGHFRAGMKGTLHVRANP